jgi:hypothetical protein
MKDLIKPKEIELDGITVASKIGYNNNEGILSDINFEKVISTLGFL